MNIRATLTTILACVALNANGFVMYPPHPFCDAVNKAWVDGDYDRISQIIADRLSKHSDDPIALSMACHSEAFIGHDSARFVEHVQRLKALADKYNKPEIFDGEIGKMYDTSDSTLAEFGKPLPAEAREEIARAFPKEFPGSLMAYMMAKFFYDDIPRLQDEFREIYEAFITTKKQLVTTTKEQLRTDATTLVHSQRPPDEINENISRRKRLNQIDEKFWPPSIAALQPSQVYWLDNGIRVAFFTFWGKSEGVLIYSNEADLSLIGHTDNKAYEIIVEGIYLYTYAD